jgi:hypothetical protein
LLGYVTYYERDVSKLSRTKVVDSQLRVFRHPREHYQKITANLLPVLSMLTSGELGRSLSPDPLDAEDTRPIMNLTKIVRGRRVFYVALDSLPDPAVGSAIGAILLADLAALAGMRYNMGEQEPRISLFVDEISEVINQPLIQILNKGAESAIHTTCSMQTLADLAERLGSEAAARELRFYHSFRVAFDAMSLLTRVCGEPACARRLSPTNEQWHDSEDYEQREIYGAGHGVPTGDVFIYRKSANKQYDDQLGGE